MKSSVLAVLMLIMVVSFGINAFAAVPKPVLNSRLAVLVPAGQPGLMEIGATKDGSECELSIGADAKGDYSVMISARTTFAMAHFYFQPYGDRNLTRATDNGTKIILFSTNNFSGQQEILVLETAPQINGKRALKSAEIIEEQSGIFGSKMKSAVKCSI